VDHREARNQAGDRRSVRSVATGDERKVSYRQAVALVSRGKVEFVQDKPKRTQKAAKRAPKKPSAEAVYADPEAPLETAEPGRSDVTQDPAPLNTSDLPSPTEPGAEADSGSNSPPPIF